MPAAIFNRKFRSLTLRAAVVFATLGVVISGCSLFDSKDKAPPVEVNLPPVNTRATLVAFLNKHLNDPSSVRDAYITEPRLLQIGVDNRYVVCVRYDAKDVFGQYAGSRDFIAIYFAGKLNQYIAATPDQCGKAPYVRYPELEGQKKPT